MTHSFNSTNRAFLTSQRDSQASNTANATARPSPIQNSVCHALALLGLGVEGVSCGGDFTAPIH